jgi:hypothetical protein
MPEKEAQLGGESSARQAGIANSSDRRVFSRKNAQEDAKEEDGISLSVSQPSTTHSQPFSNKA